MENYRFSTSLLLTAEKTRKSFPCPAKLNLFLYINGRRADGYHELQTLFQFLDFGDWLHIDLRHDKIISLQANMSDLRTEQNLVYRAAHLLQQKTKCNLGANIHLDKILPVGGGLGGGSSNAASTLVALNKLWDTRLTTHELAELGLQLGADVPVFIHGKAAFAEGVGEKITYCEPLEKYYVILKPNVSISTAAVFNEVNLPRNTPKRPFAELLHGKYTNDCEQIVRSHYPEVEAASRWLLKYAPTRLTGTGACVFAEFDNENSAQAVFRAKPKNLFGFVAKGLNISPLRQLEDLA